MERQWSYFAQKYSSHRILLPEQTSVFSLRRARTVVHRAVWSLDAVFEFRGTFPAVMLWTMAAFTNIGCFGIDSHLWEFKSTMVSLFEDWERWVYLRLLFIYFHSFPRFLFAIFFFLLLPICICRGVGWDWGSNSSKIPALCSFGVRVRANHSWVSRRFARVAWSKNTCEWVTSVSDHLEPQPTNSPSRGWRANARGSRQQIWEIGRTNFAHNLGGNKMRGFLWLIAVNHACLRMIKKRRQLRECMRKVQKSPVLLFQRHDMKSATHPASSACLSFCRKSCPVETANSQIMVRFEL